MTAMRNDLTDEEYAAQAEKGEPAKARWSMLEQLVAGLDDRIADLAYLYNCAHVEKSKRPKTPEPMRRPGIRALKPKQTISTEQADTLFQLINGGAA